MELYNFEAEFQLIGAILSRNDILQNIEYLDAEHFYYEELGNLFQEIRQKVASGLPQDVTVMIPYLRNSEFAKSFEKDNLINLFSASSNSAIMGYYKSYAKQIFDLWQKREVFNAINSFDQNNSLAEIKSELLAKFDGLELEIENLPSSVSNLMEKYIDKKVINKEVVDIIRSNYKCLDRVVGGFYPSNFVVIAGKTSIGKTTYALNLAKRISDKENGVPTYLLSIEMKEDEVLNKFLVEECSVDSYRLRNAELKENEEAGAISARNRFSDQLYLEDKAGWSAEKIYLRIKHLKKKLGIKVVIIDYLQKIVPKNYKESRERQIGGIAEDLKTMAKQLDVVVIVLCQLSRENEKRVNKRPLLSDLRDSGSIEQEADVVIFIHRDDYYLEKEAEPIYSPNYSKWLNAYNDAKGKGVAIIAKNRNGPTGQIDLNYDNQFGRFIEINF